jgi:hypothetical protein
MRTYGGGIFTCEKHLKRRITILRFDPIFMKCIDVSRRRE